MAAQVQLASEDNFHYNNAAPRGPNFNQGMEVWLGIEDYLKEHAAQYRSRIVVFSGPL